MTVQLTNPKAIAPLPLNPARALAKIAAAKDPEELRPLQADLDGIEAAMAATGRFTPDQIRKVNEIRMRAIWKLGKLLAKVEKAKGRSWKGADRPPKFKDYIASLRPSLAGTAAKEFQRIGSMPEEILEKVFARAHKDDERVTMFELKRAAQPFWKLENRARKHKAIRKAARPTTEAIGPFPLIYADPPWSFATYTPGGGGRKPDEHYPTLSLDEICEFQVAGKPMTKIAHKDAALFLWCTSSNIEIALQVMDAWGFTFKASAVWVKNKQGMGLIFRNWHEVLLYGSRGNMPGPVYVPPSVFNYPRGEHSVKPPEIRKIIEKMYPAYTDGERLELFARGTVKGWTTYGYETTT